MRTPDESRLEQIATFFGKTVEYMRRDNRPPVPGAPSLIPESGLSRMSDTENVPYENGVAASMEKLPEASPYARMSAPELIFAMRRDKVKAVYQVEVSVTSVRFVRCGEPAGS